MGDRVTVAVGAAQVFLLLVGVIVLGRVWVRTAHSPKRWDVRAQRLALRPIPARDVLLLVVMVLALVLLTVSILKASGWGESELASPRGLVIQSLPLHWGVLGTVALLLKARRRSWRRVFGLAPGRLGGDIRRGLAGYFAMLPVVVGLGFVYRLLLRTLGVELDVQDVAEILMEDAALPVRVYLFGLGIVIAPVAEEVLFRGMVFPVLARRMGPLAGMVVVSVGFGFIHGHLPSMLPLFMVSMALCLGYIYTGSIAVPAVMHMVFNAVNLMLFAAMRGAG